MSSRSKRSFLCSHFGKLQVKLVDRIQSVVFDPEVSLPGFCSLQELYSDNVITTGVFLLRP